MSAVADQDRLRAVLGPLPTYLTRTVQRVARARNALESRRGGSALALAAGYVDDAVSFAAELLDFHAHPWQLGVLRSSEPRTLLLCARQSGKSTTSAALALHMAATKAGSNVVVIAPAARQSVLFVNRAKALLADSPLRQDVEILTREIRFRNGSRIVAFPGNPATVRGETADLLILDESALMDDALYSAVLPMIAASKGRVLMLTTPFGPRGFFYKLWQEEGNGWHKVKVAASDAPALDYATLAQFRKDLPPYRYASEFEVSFDVSGAGVFRSADIVALLRPDIPELWAPEGISLLQGELPEMVYPLAGTATDRTTPRELVLSLDVGNSPDYAGLLIGRTWTDPGDKRPRIQAVHVEHVRDVDYSLMRRRVQTMVRILERHTGRRVWTVLDATGGGAMMVSEMRRDGFQVFGLNLSHTTGKRDGFKQTIGKADLVHCLQGMVQDRTLTVSNSAPGALDLITEMSAFSAVTSDKGWTSYEGKGEHDDLVIAAALAAWSVNDRPKPAVMRKMRGF